MPLYPGPAVSRDPFKVAYASVAWFMAWKRRRRLGLSRCPVYPGQFLHEPPVTRLRSERLALSSPRTESSFPALARVPLVIIP